MVPGRVFVSRLVSLLHDRERTPHARPSIGVALLLRTLHLMTDHATKHRTAERSHGRALGFVTR